MSNKQATNTKSDKNKMLAPLVRACVCLGWLGGAGSVVATTPMSELERGFLRVTLAPQ